MNASLVGLVAWIWLAGAALAQGFAGLGGDAAGFAQPQPGARPVFPRDHGAHPAFRIEWWYLTANLTDARGREYGVQWTLFRTALRPEDGTGWQTPQLWLGHAAVTTEDSHRLAERRGRGGIGQAGVRADPFAAWIDNWQMTGTAGDGIGRLRLTASGADFAYDLTLTTQVPPTLHGRDGYSVKSAAGQASVYYSQTGYGVRGRLRLPAGEIAVTGRGWFDHEWSSQPLAPDQTGWDWVSLGFDSGESLMGFRLRGQDGREFTSGTWIAPDGTASPLADGALRLTPLATAAVAGRAIPVRWRLQVAAKAVDVEITAINPRAWMDTAFAYWEGPVRIHGSHRGRGYLEMTGYEPASPR